MLLQASGVYQIEDIGEVSGWTELDHIQPVFLVQARSTAFDADQQVILRPDEG